MNSLPTPGPQSRNSEENRNSGGASCSGQTQNSYIESFRDFHSFESQETAEDMLVNCHEMQLEVIIYIFFNFIE